VPQLQGKVRHENRRSSDFAGSRIFNAFPVAYLTHFDGYDTIDISDPANPIQLGRSTRTFGTFHGIADNGSGKVLTTHSRGPDDWPVGMFDGSDPTDADQLEVEFPTQGQAADLAIHNGLAYVAGGAAGLQVINYLPYDALREPPTISLSTSLPSGQVVEGQSFWAAADALDDVQVHSVEFYIDDVLAATDGSFPFERHLRAPLRNGRSSFTLRARAIDTGGNAAWSNEITIALAAAVPDTTPPQVLRVSPGDGSVVGPIEEIAITFSEPLDPVTLTRGVRVWNAGVDGVLGNGDDLPVEGGRVSYRELTGTVLLRFDAPLSFGLYQVVMAPSATDRAGHPLGEHVSTFRVARGALGLSELHLDNVGGVDGLNSPSSVVVSPDDNHVYVTSWECAGLFIGCGSLAVFDRGPTGELSTIQVLRNNLDGVEGLSGTTAAAISHDGAHLYVASRGGSLAVFSRNAATGELAFVQVLKDGVDGMDGLARAIGVVVSPDGSYVYVTASDDNSLTVFARDAVTGQLDLAQVLRDGSDGVDALRGTEGLAVSPDGTHVYVGASRDSAVTVFVRDPETGELAPAQTLTHQTSARDGLRNPDSLVFSPDGRHIYVTGGPASGRSGITAFSRDESTGELSFLQELLHPALVDRRIHSPNAVAISPDGDHVYMVANELETGWAFGGSVAVFNRDKTSGTLTFLQVVRDQVHMGGLRDPTALAVSHDGRQLYVTSNRNNTLAVFSRALEDRPIE
jgi:6-phosphogluconolactonase (cycloisomerase 2 family)